MDRIKNKFNFREIQILSLLFSESENLQIAESLPPLLMERAGKRRIKQAFSIIFYSPHPNLSRWRGIVVLRAE